MDESKKKRPLRAAIAILGLLVYTVGVCAAAVFVDRQVYTRQKAIELPMTDDSFAAPAPARAEDGILELGEIITAQGDCEFTVTDCAFSRQAFAPGARTGDPGYEANSDAEGYVDLTVLYKNLNDTATDIDGIASPLLTCANGDAYSAFAVIENTNGNRFVEYALVSPRRSAQLHYLFQVPRAVGEGAFKINFTIAGQAYTIGFAEGFTE